MGTQASEEQLTVEQVIYDGRLLAIVVRRDFRCGGLRFFTPHIFSQQLAYMHYPVGKLIDAHIHNPVPREVRHTQEVLLIKRGQLRVDLYDAKQHYVCSRILEGGDLILLAEGGHGFEVLKEVEMIEVKQGPYPGEEDKSRFAGVDPALLRVEP